MPLGLGGSIGHAFVEVSVRGDGMDRDVRKILNDAVDDADFESTGRRAGKDFTAGFGDQFDDDMMDRFKDLNKRPGWKRAIANLDWSEALAKNTDNYFKSPNWKKFVKESAQRWGDVGELAAKEMEAGFRARGSTDGIEEDQRRMQQRVNALRERLRKQDSADLIANEKKQNKELERLAREQMQAREHEFNTRLNMERQIAEFRRREAKRRSDDEQKAAEDAERGLRLNLHMARLAAEFRARQAKTQADADKAHLELMKLQAKEAERAEKDLNDARLAAMHTDANMARAAEEFHRQRMKQDREEKKAIEERNKRLTRMSTRTIRAFTRIEDGVGGLFGRGSRNNFLNFIGSAMRGMTKLVLFAPKMAAKVGESLAKTFTEAGGGLSGTFAAGIQLVGGALLGLAAAGPVAAAGLAALSVVIGPLMALLSGLLGIVLALASTLAFALVGAVGVLAASLVPLVAGIAVVVGGFKSMTDAQKTALKTDIKPLTDNFKDLGQTAFKAITKDIGQNAKDLAPVIKDLNPLVEGLGTAISNIGSSWTKSVTSPAFKRFRKTLEKELPGMLESLGESAGNTAGGLGGLFTGAIPATQSFLGWLERVTQRFSDWANSTKGQAQIRTFFDKAKTSVKALKGFLDDVWDTTTDILDAGKGTGDSLFETMGEQVRKFGDYLEAHPDALKDFFANAKETATNLGNLAVSVGRIFDELDNETNRKNLQTFVGAITAASEAINALQTGDAGKDSGGLTKFFAGLSSLNSADWANPASGGFLGLDKVVAESIDEIQTIGDHLPKIRWRSIIPEDLKWGDFIPDIGPAWARFRNSLHWGNLIPKLDWADFIPFKIPWGKVGKLSWSILVDLLPWSSFIKKIDWSKVNDLDWGDVIEAINWFDWIDEIDWSDFVPSIDIDINWPSIPSRWAKVIDGGLPWTASGGVFEGAQHRIIGEAGPEAVVPLRRPLSQVDPSVRWLSAIAQGQSVSGQVAPPQPTTARTVIESGAITVITPASDARAVAWETLNYITAAGY